MIDWTNPNAMVSQHMSVADCLFLPQYNRLANVADGLDDRTKRQLLDFCSTICDVVIDSLLANGISAVTTTSMFRPTGYNILIGGATRSGHLFSLHPNDPDTAAAWDFVPRIPGMTAEQACSRVRELLRPRLEELGLRSELDASNWVHLDTLDPNKYSNGRREFIARLGNAMFK